MSDQPAVETTPPLSKPIWKRVLLFLAAFLIGAIWWLVRIGVVTWASLAIYYSNLPWPQARVALAVAFALTSIWLLWVSKRPRAINLFLGLFGGVVIWWMTIMPSHDRNWREEVAVMPTAVVEGDRILIQNFRNFDYRSRDDFTVRYEDREYDLSHLTGIDFYISYWKKGPVGHTFLSFLFDNAPPLCISIETRPEVGEGFDPLASLFKQFELIYVVGDERDLVGVRTNHRREDVFLFHILTSPESARRLLLIYLDRINQLAEEPEFYHLLKNNCALNIVRYANAAGREGTFHFGHLFNGLFDVYLYDHGWLDTSNSLDELREKGHLNEVAQSIELDENFSSRIRKAIPEPDLEFAAEESEDD